MWVTRGKEGRTDVPAWPGPGVATGGVSGVGFDQERQVFKIRCVCVRCFFLFVCRIPRLAIDHRGGKGTAPIAKEGRKGKEGRPRPDRSR